MRLIALATLVACNHPGRFGKTAEPFGLFANIKMGMTTDEVAKLAPELKPDPSDPEHWLVKAASSDGGRYEAYFVDGHLTKFEILPPRRRSSVRTRSMG